MAALVDIAIQDRVATLTLDDGKANALSLAMSQALMAAGTSSPARVTGVLAKSGLM